MANPYLCPNCKSNRSRFNLIEQVVTPVKLNSISGMILDSFQFDDAGPLHLQYNGPIKRVQCATCGVIEDEKLFIKRAET